MPQSKVSLPEGGRSRILGKAGAKIADIRKVSGAQVEVSGNLVIISGTIEEEELAVKLIKKAVKHMTAAAQAPGELARVEGTADSYSSEFAEKADIKMAAFFTNVRI
jgi:rRNA processing protein Krr1/Pno1